jgi:hypothetical protein
MSFKGKINRYKKKYDVYSHYAKGTFDLKDKSRLKPMTRLRQSVEEIELEKNCDIDLRVRDWYKDIDSGFSK